MDNGNFINQLRDIRSNLRDAIRAASKFETKLLGPRPEDGQKPKDTSESVISFLTEINAMSIQLTKMLAHHHEIVGDFEPMGLPEASPARYA